MNFEEWLYKACENLSVKHNIEIDKIYSNINLTEAKMYYLDGLEPSEFNMENNW